MISLTKKHLLLCFIVYSISSIFLLTNYSGIYWDDWAIHDHSYAELVNMFKQAAGISGCYTALIHWSLNQIFNGVFIYRLLTFILTFISAVFLYEILKTIKYIKNDERLYITILVLISPLFSAKVPLIDFPYTLSYFLFFLGFFLISKNWFDSGYIKRYITILLFFFSFLVQSLIPFYSIVLLYIFCKNYDPKIGFINNTLKYFKNKLSMLMVVFLFAVCKFTIFQPSGLYANYNKVNISINSLYTDVLLLFKNNLFQPIVESYNLLSHSKVLIGILFIAIITIILRTLKNKTVLSNIDKEGEISSILKRPLCLLGIGILLFTLGGLPYILVGKNPVLHGPNSRHELLLPLGFAIIVLYFLKSLVRNVNININSSVLKINIISKIPYHWLKAIETSIISGIIIGFISLTSFNLYNYNKYEMYQDSIVLNFESSPIIRNNSTFFYKADLIPGNSFFRPYTFNNQSKEAFGTLSKLFVPLGSQEGFYSKFCTSQNWACSNWKPTKPVDIFLIKNKDIHSRFFLKLKLYQIFDKSKYNELVKSLISIQQSEPK